MKVVTWNVNGIRARELQVVEWLEREKPDILCLQELKAAPDQIPLSLLPSATAGSVMSVTTLSSATAFGAAFASPYRR